MLSQTAYLTIKKQFTLHLSVRSGWVGGGGAVTDEKGGLGKGGGSGPPDPPSEHAYAIRIEPLLTDSLRQIKETFGQFLTELNRFFQSDVFFGE